MKPASTRPVASHVSWEAYCEALGVEPSEARDASLVRALHAYLGAGRIAEPMSTDQPIINDNDDCA